MTKYSPIILVAMALLPMTANTAQAGRRNMATPQRTTVPAIKADLSNFSGWMKTAFSQIQHSLGFGENTVSAAAAVEMSPPAAGGVAQGELAAAPRRPRGANLIVVLLVPKPVVSNQ